MALRGRRGRPSSSRLTALAPSTSPPFGRRLVCEAFALYRRFCISKIRTKQTSRGFRLEGRYVLRRRPLRPVSLRFCTIVA